MAILRLTHIGICVADLERARRFYVDGLGFTPRSALHVTGEPARTLLRLPDLDLHAAYLERDGVRIELLHYRVPGTIGDASPRPMNARGLTHLSLRVDDLAATLPPLAALGGRVLDDSRIALPGTGPAAVLLTDPDGTLIELVQAPGDPATAPGA